jgi:hypothetical protein
MIYDDYAFKLLNEERSSRKAFPDHEGKTLGEYYDTFDYDKLKLFFMSVLFRAGLSNDPFFQHVTLGPYEAPLKAAFDRGIAPHPNVFAIFLQYYDEITSGPVFLPPGPIRFNNIKFYFFHIGRVMFYIKVDRRSPPKDLQHVILKPQGGLFLMRRTLKDSNVYDILKRMINNPANARYFSS